MVAGPYCQMERYPHFGRRIIIKEDGTAHSKMEPANWETLNMSKCYFESVGDHIEDQRKEEDRVPTLFNGATYVITDKTDIANPIKWSAVYSNFDFIDCGPLRFDDTDLPSWAEPYQVSGQPMLIKFSPSYLASEHRGQQPATITSEAGVLTVTF